MSAVNEELIRQYQSDKVIIKTYYTDEKGVNVDGVVNPLKIDNRQLVAPTDNQTRYPACAGYSACTLVETLYWKRTGKLVQLDSKQVYAKAKELDGERDVDGTYLETSLQAALQLCDFGFLQSARIQLFANGGDADTVERVKFLLHRYDFVQVGFQIDEAWYDCDSQNYVIGSGGRALGGHAVLLVGYDQSGFYVHNQWGTSWAAKGFGVIPYGLFLQELMYGAYLGGLSM